MTRPGLPFQWLPKFFILWATFSISFSTAWMNQRPLMEVRDGNLFVTSAMDRNITFRTLGKSSVNVNEIDLQRVANSAKNAALLVERWRSGVLVDVQNTLARLVETIEGRSGLLTRVNALEFGTGSNTTEARPGPRQNGANEAIARARIQRLTARVRQTEIQISNILKKLETDECTSNPCQNGGTCEDLIDGYKCRCLDGWEGPNCSVDVNECFIFFGTDLGCQNGATCQNLPGTYRCSCQQGWYGIHCTQQVNNCTAPNSQDLCGHGFCVDRPNANPSYKCVCDQGWETDGITPACTKDVDECAGRHPACSVNPLVPCINVPGTFYCGGCPHGYTGNGYYCTDIDECAINNGGCSTSPSVQCINTMGSRMCGTCPAGYQGDGVTCTYLGSCRINNGGCHPLATCVNTPGMSDWLVLCRCPSGYRGDGLGPNGCTRDSEPSNSACNSNPCHHGTCLPNGAYDYTCRCEAGYTGKNCDIGDNPCDPNPCKNGGTCSVSAERKAVCQCRAGFTGSKCGKHRASCGAIINEHRGRLEFPQIGQQYPNSLSCAWVLKTNETFVLNLTFTAFNLEQSNDCQHDFVQIHDGPSAGENLIGRYCGTELPRGGNIISSQHALYLWFHSDHSITNDGFTIEWNSIAPLCGGEINADHGSVTSPGSPGKYPNNRDCVWHIEVTPGKRIQLHFFNIMLEEHPTCAKDYLEIREGPSLSERRLRLFCNHTHPPPLITTDNEVWLHFHSDDSIQDSGFQITFSAIEGFPGCGGVYTASSGLITSPNYHNDRYASSLDCEWRIEIPSGERLQITWTIFDIEGSRNCMFDFVEVFDGANREAPLIGRYCGVQLPPTILSTTNTLLVRFRSDWALGGKGFLFNYEVWCGGEFTEENGVLTSPYYPQPYPAARTCTYKIIQPPGKAISLTIQDMDIEGLDPQNCYFDYLEIYDGDSQNSSMIGTYCGTNSSIPEFPIISTHNYMWIKFHTDYSTQKRGFMATYTTVDRRCGGILKESLGIIETPSEEGRYGNDEDCTWIIQAPPGYVVQLNWLTFNLESGGNNCYFDYIKISENLTSTSQQDLGTYCGGTKPPTMTSQSQIMSVKFHTDSSFTREGFMATYIFIDASKICGGHFVSSTGVIQSPNYPEHYPASKECEWVITAPNRHQVVLTVKKFDLEQHSNCQFDYLEIRTGALPTSPLIGKYCGTDIPRQIKSFGNELFVKFKSDSSRGGEGFNIEWDSSTMGCGGTLTATSGSISSPGYPQPYGHRAECNWKIRVSAGSIIQFSILDFDLEEHARCRYDFLELYDGPDAGKHSLGKYCGSRHPSHINTTSNTATIRFDTDWSRSGRGFHMNYQAVCSHKLRSFRGVIESPNFPNNYPDRVNCTWIIEAPMGNKLNITFSHFDLEDGSVAACPYDHLKIEEGTDDRRTRTLGTFCGSNILPPKIVSTENQVFLEFYSDSWTARNGFRLEWVVNGCGGSLTHPEGTIISPGYPNSYPDNVECEWTIEVDYGHSIEITLEEVKLEKTQDCPFDSLAIYTGPDATAPRLFKACHIDKPVVLTSSSNKLFLKFHSDFSYQNKGFKANYKSVDIECGGKFTAPSGLIHSRNYPLNYPPNQYCEWLIQVSPNHLVNLTFTEFDIEDTTNCTDDYVAIHDGSTPDSPVLGLHCHNVRPPSYITTSNEMLVIMRSDSMISAKGFKASYDLACGARIVTNDQGIISMDPTMGLHTEIVNCTWIIVAQELEDHVTLTLTDLQLGTFNFGMDDCYDSFVQVFEGEGTDGLELFKLCNTTVPPPITSRGNALTIHVATEYGGLYNVRFSGTYSVLNSACGGNYTSEHGAISTPGYPDNYPRNIECVWNLRTTPGSAITLNFREFEVIQSDNCDLDYLEVREENGAGKLLGVYCGEVVNQISSLKNLWVKFRSSADGTKKGFVADYSLKHGNDLSGPSGDIASPLYPNPCIHEDTYYWRIEVDPASSIEITFKDFYLENYGDTCYVYLTIFDGYNDEAPELMTKCGVSLPETVRSTSNVVYIKFHINALRFGSWFLLSWLQIPRYSDSGETLVVNNECKEIISLNNPENTSYTFSSPGWPTGYEENLDCSWIFESVPGTHLVLKFHKLDLEQSLLCTMDHVTIYSGNSLTQQRDWNEVGKWCRSNSTSLEIATSNLMKVNFRSDYSYNKTGFNATVSKVCGGQLYRPNGLIEFNSTTNTSRSGRWNAVTCQWNVTVKPGRMIEVEFISMDILSTSNRACTDNYLVLKNGGSPSSPLLGTGTYCHSELPGTLQTTGNQLYVKVTGLRSHTQFKLVYREVGLNCGNQIVLTEELSTFVIKTPNYPEIPSPHTECFWTVMAPAGEQISIHFLDRFDLTSSATCDDEYLEIRDGGTESSKLLGKYCGQLAPSSLRTTGNVLYLHFYTDVHDPKNGFKAVVKIDDHCGGILRARKGILQSPNYPASYPTNVSCSWYIIVPRGLTLKLEFRDIDLPIRLRCENTDNVAIADRIPHNDTTDLVDTDDLESKNTLTIGSYCGNSKPPVITTSSNEAMVLFTSDSVSSPNYRGFRMNFTSTRESCGGSLDGISGEFSSPGYPNVVSNMHRFCEWQIKAPEGYRIKVEILDMDFGEAYSGDPTNIGARIVFYNDLIYHSRIKRLDSSTTDREVLSTSSTMLIYYWSGIVAQRGFKARYSRTAPALCGSVLTNSEGTLLTNQSPIFNLTAFNCHWRAENPSMNLTRQTLAITASGVIGDTVITAMNSCPYRAASILLSSDSERIACISGNLSQEVTVRSPSPINKITASKASWSRGRIQFNLKYRWNQCGGILGGPRHVISAPTNVQKPVDCVWHAKFPDNGEVIVLSFKKLNLAKCSGNFITVRNGGSLAPEIGKYCGSIKQADIISQSNQLWIEYHAEDQNNEFELELSSRQGGCGGLIQGSRSSEIMSPGYPQQYPNNAECMWEIVVEEGYHIGLEFVDRFNLETSTDCSSDFIQVFDHREDIDTGIKSWYSLGKVCGRNTPSVYNSTGSKMKILFRSNDAIVADGFRAIWNENCGGIIEVSKQMKYLHSPGWPIAYRGRLTCNYTFLAPDKNFMIEFTDFELERGSEGCQFDNVSLISDDGDDPSVWCGTNRPPMQRVQSRFTLILKTDKYVHRKGFQIRYLLDECGGVLTEPGDIESPTSHETGTYYSRINCTWLVRAPPGKNIVLRFERLLLEFSSMCYFDYVAIYSGPIINQENRLAVLCGSMNGTLPPITASNGTMTINFVTDHSYNFGGFAAKVVFTLGAADGCGGNIELSGSRTFKTQKGAMYESLQDCHWVILVPRGDAIKLEMTSVDLRNSSSSSGGDTTQPCSGDYLEIRDGAGPLSELIGIYCGNVIPPPITSSTNALWIRFVSDGTVNGNGVTATLTDIQSPCGDSIIVVGNQTNIIKSPNFPGRYPGGLKCRWLLSHEDRSDQWKRVTLHFLQFDLTDSANCTGDVLSISDKHTRNYISEGLGQEFVFSGTSQRPLNFWRDVRRPSTTYIYCGSALPHDYYSVGGNLEIQFKTSESQPTGHTGFRIEYSSGNCPRNFTGIQGRIVHEEMVNCSFTITAPVGNTISVYFNDFLTVDYNSCVNNALVVYDGEFSGRSFGTLCGITLPNPIFSSGNKLSFRSWSADKFSYGSYDMTYTTTDKGRGCGGKLFNYDGQFSSPLYPEPYRNASECTWEVRVPTGLIVTLKFKVFDLGRRETCATDFITINDLLPNGDTLSSTTYCGEDEPAWYHSSNEKISVTYRTSVNNGGTGWIIDFSAKHRGQQ